VGVSTTDGDRENRVRELELHRPREGRRVSALERNKGAPGTTACTIARSYDVLKEAGRGGFGGCRRQGSAIHESQRETEGDRGGGGEDERLRGVSGGGKSQFAGTRI